MILHYPTPTPPYPMIFLSEGIWVGIQVPKILLRTLLLEEEKLDQNARNALSCPLIDGELPPCPSPRKWPPPTS